MKKEPKTKKPLESNIEDISRKEAIKKAGRYAAVTAGAMLIVLHPKKAQADSPPDPGGGW